jgi:hypothetical protein
MRVSQVQCLFETVFWKGSILLRIPLHQS